MDVCEELIVPPKSARALTVSRGQTVRIIDLDGGQPGDFVALKADDLSVKLSQARTRVENGRASVTQGHALWTNTFPPEVMFTIARDTYGTHDLLYPPCCRYALEKRFGVSQDGCLEHLAEALKPWKVRPREIPDPLNLFFRVSVGPTGGMEIYGPDSKPGSLIELRAEMDSVVAVSTCSAPADARGNSAYRIQVLGP